MSLRDLTLFALLLAIVVMAPRRPFVGALAWVLFGVMNPHRLSWGSAYSFPFAAVIAGVTLLGVLLTKEHRQLKGGAAAGVLMLFLGWSAVTTLFAFQPELSFAYFLRVVKIFGMTLVLLLLMHSKRDVILLVSTLVLSLGFFGIKGGAFVLATGGAYMVNGPPGSVMEGNNSLGVGLTMCIPLMYFLMQQSSNKWIRRALVVAMVLCAVSVLGAYSRGAMLAISAMAIVLWLRGRNKIFMLLMAAVMIAVAIPAMPARWFDKMDTLQNYDHDDSAMFRLYTWETAYNIAKDKFPLAGGFEWESPAASARYSPLPTLVLVPHSIYFQTIGSQGFIGLVLFLSFWMLVWRDCGWLRKRSRSVPSLQWAHVLGSMVQVSLAGYFVGGAFLDLAFWDLPYYLYAAVAAARYVVQKDLEQQSASGAGTAAAVQSGQPNPAMRHPAPAATPDADHAAVHGR